MHHEQAQLSPHTCGRTGASIPSGAGAHHKNKELAGAFNMWLEQYPEAKRRRALLQRIIGRVVHRELSVAIGKWASMHRSRKSDSKIDRHDSLRLEMLSLRDFFQDAKRAFQVVSPLVAGA